VSRAEETHAHRAFGAFCFLWGSATLFHIASFDKWGESLTTFALAAAAVALIVRPTSVPRLLMLATIQLYSLGDDLPYVSNHWLFTGFVNLTILGSWLMSAYRGGSFAVAPADLLRAFGGLARIELLGLYFFVTLHKLNSDYFDPDTSCGAGFYSLQADRFPFLPDASALRIGSMYLTPAVESAIPVLLCFRRTRTAGVLLGLAFHTVIGFNPVSGFYNFSSMLYAMLFLFAPKDLASRFVELWRELRARAERLARSHLTEFSGRTAVTCAGTVALALVLLRVLDHAVDDQFLLVWAAYSATLTALFVFLAVRRRPTEDPGPRRLFEVPYPQLAWLPLLLLLNGASPYLGLKTETSFSMFSNLRTEGGKSNHLFIPADSQPFGLQKHLVEITSSSEPALQRWADQEQLLPWLEFRAQTSRYPDASVSYVRDGTAHQVQRIGDDHELAHKPWARKVLVFRPVPKEGRQRCVH
jgi:hypothetical protein